MNYPIMVDVAVVEGDAILYGRVIGTSRTWAVQDGDGLAIAVRHPPHSKASKPRWLHAGVHFGGMPGVTAGRCLGEVTRFRVQGRFQ